MKATNSIFFFAPVDRNDGHKLSKVKKKKIDKNSSVRLNLPSEGLVHQQVIVEGYTSALVFKLTPDQFATFSALQVSFTKKSFLNNILVDTLSCFHLSTSVQMDCFAPQL